MKKTWKHIVLSLLIPLSCGAQKQKKSLPAEYEENLSAVRITLESALEQKINAKTPSSQQLPSYNTPTVAYTVNDLVDVALDSIAMLKKTKRYLNGYSIQVYTGRNRQEAFAVKSDFSMKIEEGKIDKLDILLEYNQPNFLITAGHYFSALEAQKDLMLLRQYFPKAILIPTKIAIVPPKEEHAEPQQPLPLDEIKD